MMAPGSYDMALMAEAEIYDFEPEWMPPGFELVQRSDALYWSARTLDRGGSRVAWVKWSDDQIGPGMEAILSFFRERDRPFSWCVGPSTTAPDISRQLQQRGLLLQEEARMLWSQLPLAHSRINPDVNVREVEDEEGAKAALCILHPDWPEERLRSSVIERTDYLSFPKRRGGMVLAVLGEKPAGAALWRDSGDGRCVYLTAAATVSRYRSQGVYSTLLAYRTDQARKRGRIFATTRARKETSLPILTRSGFQDCGSLTTYGHPRFV